MNFNEIYNSFLELKETLGNKKEAIIKKQLDVLTKLDEETVVIMEKINKNNLKELSKNFSEEEKEKLKKIGNEIKKIEENNEILIKHSVDVINNVLSGILNIAQKEKGAYNAKGLECQHTESLDISSITEEA